MSQVSEPQPADALVIFGITGDLARRMTFRSLYRLERRGLLKCGVIGVAVDNWNIDQLRDRARKSIEETGEKLDEAVFKSFADRLSYVSGDFAHPDTSLPVLPDTTVLRRKADNLDKKLPSPTAPGPGPSSGPGRLASGTLSPKFMRGVSWR